MSDQPLDPHPSAPKPKTGAWPFLVGALAAAAAGTWLLTAAPQDPAPAPAPTVSSAAAATRRAASSPAPAGASAAAESTAPTASPARETTLETPRSSAAATSGNALVSAGSTSPERSAQIQVEQAAQERAVQGLEVPAKEQAQDLARRFVEAMNTRTWQTSRQQWRAPLTELASEELVQAVDLDNDWESEAHRRFVKAQGRSTAQVIQARAQTVQGERVEVAVIVATETASEDPWVTQPRKERPVTVVIDLRQKRVVEQIDMTPHGGL